MPELSGRELALQMLAEEQSGGTPAVQVKTRKRGVGQWDDLIEKHASTYGVDPDLIRAVMRQESGRLGPTARSPVGAYGLMQVMPGTWREMGGGDRNDPNEQVRVGTAYFAKQLKAFGGDTRKALAAYNAGPGAVQKYGGIPPYAETQHYVKTITAAYNRQQALRARSGGAPMQLASRGGAAPIPADPNLSGAELARRVLAAEGGSPIPTGELSGADLARQILAQERQAPTDPAQARIAEALKRRGNPPPVLQSSPPRPAAPGYGPTQPGLLGIAERVGRSAGLDARRRADLGQRPAEPWSPPFLRTMQGPSAAQAAAQQLVTLPKPKKPGTLAFSKEELAAARQQGAVDRQGELRREFVQGPRAFNPYTYEPVRKRKGSEIAGAVAEGALFPSGQIKKEEAQAEFRQLVQEGKAAPPPQLSSDPKRKQAELTEIGRIRQPIVEYLKTMRYRIIDPVGSVGRFQPVRDNEGNGEEYLRQMKIYREEEAKRLRLYLDRTKPENVVRYLEAQGHKLTPLQRQAARNVADAAAHWTVKQPEITNAYLFDTAVGLIADRFGARMATGILAKTALKGPVRAVAGTALEGFFAGGPQQAATRKYADPKATAADLAGEYALGSVGGLAVGGVLGVGGAGVRKAASSLGSLPTKAGPLVNAPASPVDTHAPIPNVAAAPVPTPVLKKGATVIDRAGREATIETVHRNGEVTVTVQGKKHRVAAEQFHAQQPVSEAPSVKASQIATAPVQARAAAPEAPKRPAQSNAADPLAALEQEALTRLANRRATRATLSAGEPVDATVGPGTGDPVGRGPGAARGGERPTAGRPTDQGTGAGVGREGAAATGAEPAFTLTAKGGIRLRGKRPLTRAQTADVAELASAANDPEYFNRIVEEWEPERFDRAFRQSADFEAAGILDDALATYRKWADDEELAWQSKQIESAKQEQRRAGYDPKSLIDRASGGVRDRYGNVLLPDEASERGFGAATENYTPDLLETIYQGLNTPGRQEKLYQTSAGKVSLRDLIFDLRMLPADAFNRGQAERMAAKRAAKAARIEPDTLNQQGKPLELKENATLAEAMRNDIRALGRTATPAALVQRAQRRGVSPAQSFSVLNALERAGEVHRDGGAFRNGPAPRSEAADLTLRSTDPDFGQGKLFQGRTSLDPEDLSDYAQFGAVKLARGTVEPGAFKKALTQQFGEEVKPHLDTIYRAAREHYEAQLKPAHKLPDLPEPKGAWKAQAEQEMNALRPRSREELAKVLQKTARMTPARAEAAATVFDAVVQTTAKRRGVDAETIYEKVEYRRGGESGPGALEQGPGTPEFRRWFAGSKVTDESGKPQVVYHGSGAGKFDEFDPKRLDNDALYGPGFYFTEDRPTAVGYTRKGIRYFPPKEAPKGMMHRAERYLNSQAAIDAAWEDVGIRESYNRAAQAWKAGPDEFRQFLAEDNYFANELRRRFNLTDSTAHLFETHLSIKNPLVMEEEITPSQIRSLLEANANLGGALRTMADGGKVTGSTVHSTLRELFRGDLARVNAFLKANGFDGISHIGGHYTGNKPHRVWIAFEPTQIKSTANRGTFDPNDPNILRQEPRRRKMTDFDTRAQAEKPEFKQWFGDSKVTDEKGVPKVVYAGHYRTHEFGPKFKVSKTTSGRFYFTENPEIASNYATGKPDVHAQDVESYAEWFKFPELKGKGERTVPDMRHAWYRMTPEQRTRFQEVIRKTGLTDDGELDFSGEHPLVGADHWAWSVREARGNWLMAAHETWLNSGTLFDDEESFVKILREAGLKPDFDNPHVPTSGVLPVYLSIKNPLDTEKVPEAFVQAMERMARTDRSRAKKWGYDFWDKDSITPKEWAQMFLADLKENGNSSESSVWTRIPEKITQEMKALGFDGVKDLGGKMGGPGHGVWIAFEPEQIKSPFNRGTFDPASPNILHQEGRPTAPTFFSQAEKVLEAKMPNRASAAQVRGILDPQKGSGVKPEELKWTGLDDFLAEREGGPIEQDRYKSLLQVEKEYRQEGVPLPETIRKQLAEARAKHELTKAEVLEFVRQNRVEVKEVVTPDPKAEARFEELQAVREKAHDDQLKMRDRMAAAVAAHMRKVADVSDETVSFITGNVHKLNEAAMRVAPEAYQAWDEAWLRYTRASRDVDQARVDRKETRFGQYTLPGGKSYRELLLTLPEKSDDVLSPTKWTAREYRLSEEDASRRVGTTDSWMEPYHRYRSEFLSKRVPPYRSTHWDEPNVLAHVRFDERVDADGKKVLHVAEIQSDWHQAGRKKGYQQQPTQRPTAEIEADLRRIITKADEARGAEPRPAGVPARRIDPNELYRTDPQYRALRDELDAASAEESAIRQGVPAAPFSKTWHELAMKRMLRWAAENGFDRVTWDTGATAADRFDLSKHVGKVMWDEDTKTLTAWDPAQQRTVIQESGVTAEKLPDYIGKEVAEKLVAVVPDEEGSRILSGLDLKVGGEGMKGFYDTILPTFAAKYGKKWGAAVGKTKIETGQPTVDMRNSRIASDGSSYWVEADGRQVGPKFDAAIKAMDHQAELRKGTVEVHSIEVTPAMKESVLTEGQPLHQQGTDPQGSISFDEANNAVLSFFKSANVTTPFHEWGHFFRRVALDEPDLKIAEAWAGAKDGVWDVAAEEKFARGFERYLRDGKAPTPELKSVFEKIRKWFLEVYTKITGSEIDVQLSPEMKDLFDRMLGGEGRLKHAEARAAAPAKVQAPDPYIGSLNRMKLPKETHAFLEETYAANQDAIDAARRGTRTWEQTNERANALLKSGAINVGMLKDSSGRAFNAEEQRAIARLHVRLTDDVADALAAYAQDGSIPNLEKVEAAKAAFDIANLAHHGAATEAGRALNIRKQFIQGYRGELATEQVAKLYEPLPDTVDKTLERRKAAVGAKLFPREKGLAALNALRKRFGGGKPVGEKVLFQEGKDLTATPEFGKWFGGSAVQKNGQPVVVHHGTARGKFEVFDTQRVDKSALYGPGFYFTEDPNVAKSYTTKVGEVRLDRSLTDQEWADLRNARKTLADADRGDIEEVLRAGVSHQRLAEHYGQTLADKLADLQPHVSAAYLNIKDPFNVDARVSDRVRARILDAAREEFTHKPTGNQLVDDVLGKKGENILRAIGEAKTGQDIFEALSSGPITTARARAGSVLRKAGFDGVTHVGGGRFDPMDANRHRVWIAFEPTQIKSVKNRGTFDPNNPNILLQSPLPPDLRAELLDAGGWLLDAKYNTEPEWRAEMLKQVGAGAEPYLAETWRLLRTEARARAEQAAKVKRAKLPEDVAREKLLRQLDGAEPGEELLKQLAAAGDDPVKLSRILKEQQKTTAAQWLTGAYKSSLTSGPKTHLTNIVSTQLHMALRTPDKFFAGAWDAVISKLPEREREHFIREAMPSAAGLKIGFKQGIRDWVGTMKEGVTPDALLALDLPRELPGGLKNPFVINQRLQGASDAFNKSLIFNQATISEATRRGLKEGLRGEQLARRVEELLDTDEVRDVAFKEAKEYTFNSDADGWAKKVLELREKAGLAGHLIVPFASTPINVAKSAWMHSPAGFITALQRLKSGGDVSDALGKATTGTLLLLGAAAALKNTEMTGAAPQDPAARDDFYRTGRQPYAFKVGDRWVSYQSQGPLTTILATVASLRENYWDRGTKEPLPVWVRGILAAARSFKDQSALTGLSAISDAIDNPERRGQAFLNRQATGLVPFSSLLRSIQQAGDPYLRDPKTPGEAIKSIIPGVGQEVQPRRDAHGRPVNREPGGAGVMQRFVVGKESRDRVDRELHQLKVFPSILGDKVKIGDTEHKLTPEQHAAYREIVGEVVYRKLERIITAPNYGKTPDGRPVPEEIREKLLRQIIGVYRSEGRKSGGRTIYGGKQIVRAALQAGRDPIPMLQQWRDQELGAARP